MNEAYWAERFSRELDGLISQAEKTPTNSAPAKFHEARQVAEDLTQLNFSAESRQRDVLRRRLLAQAHQTQEAHMKTLRWRRAVTWSIVGTVAALMLTPTLFYPGGVAAAARQMIETIRTITLGPYSSVNQVAPNEKSDRPLESDMWEIHTEIGGFAGNSAPGVEPVVQSFATVEEAQAAAGMHLLTPSYLPDGYVLREVKVAPLSDTCWIISLYSGPAHDLIIAQLPAGPLPSINPNEVRSAYTGIMTNETVEVTDLDGRPAVWGNGNILAWDIDNTTYEVGGVGLTLAEAKQIARSLH